MATTTTRLVLRKPDPTAGTGDFVSASLDLNANWDKVDAAVGAIACTSGARPGSPYNGQFARETDTGNLILWNGAAWKRVLLQDDARWPVSLDVERGTATSDAITGRVTGDTQDRWRAECDGGHFWGTGAASVDTRIRRTAASELTLDDGSSTLAKLVSDSTLWRAQSVLGGTTATVTFSGIPTNLRRLTVYWTARGSNASTSIEVRMRVNNISTATYDTQYTQGNGAAANGGLVTGATGGYIGEMAAASATANMFGSGRVDIAGWNAPHSNYLSWVFQGGTVANGGRNITGHGTQSGAGSFNRLDFIASAGSFVAGSAFYLEGTWT